MRPGTEYAVIEMGAYGKGSIGRLCRFTPPQAGIITCVGTAHLERFKSEEVIYQTKSELAKSIPPDGILVCNGDNSGARRAAQEYPKRVTLLYGFSDPSFDCWVKGWSVTSKGTTFTLVWQGKEYSGIVPQYGEAALSNVVAAFTMAAALGSDPHFLMAAIAHLHPIDNRLQVRQEGDILMLRDAYNSNPTGFACALDVMHSLPGERKVLMTPGMIELGDQQYAENAAIGERAAAVCDQVLLVGPTNTPAIREGLLAGGMREEQIMLCETREQAFEGYEKLKKSGDVLLIENDLTDLYEEKVTF
jgi:UDP-N-acetylmuramoyl-tripeptide--D-alanyl-D-alanine ligase